MNSKHYYIETYGCQMNEHDSEKMAFILEEMGYQCTDNPGMSDVIIVNTCSIREKSEHKVYSALGTFRPIKSANPNSILVVAGCVAQQEKERLLKRVPHLDIVLGTHQIASLPSFIQEVALNRSRLNRVEFQEKTASLHLPAPKKGSSSVSSYVTIMQGCSNFCSYCIVPYTRGPEQSRPLDAIVNEVVYLSENGIAEITLLGQNVNAYGKDLANGTTFPTLLRALNETRKLRRIRFTTSHPRDAVPEMIQAIADSEKVCEHIHLPLQSGSNSVLKAMRRGYTFESYDKTVTLLRNIVPGIAITSDIIVGFPGETERDFDETCRALENIRFDQIFSFKYSVRPGTTAASLKDHVSEEEKGRRLSIVHEIQGRITESYHRASEGTLQSVLIEGLRPSDGQPFGRTRTNKIVNLENSGTINPGTEILVTITKGLRHSLKGMVTKT